MNSIGIHTAENRIPADSITLKKKAAVPSQTVEAKKAVQPTDKDLQVTVTVKLDDVENSFAFPFSAIPNSDLSPREISTLVTKMGDRSSISSSSQDIGSSFSNSFIAILLRAMETFMNSMSNINKIMQDSFKQTLAALESAGKMADISISIAKTTHATADTAAKKQMLSAIGSLVTASLGAGQIYKAAKSPNGNSQKFSDAAEQITLKPELQDVSQKLSSRADKLKDMADAIEPKLGGVYEKELQQVKATAQNDPKYIENKSKLEKFEASVQGDSKTDAGKEAIAAAKKAAKDFETDHAADIKLISDRSRNAVKDVKIDVDLSKLTPEDRAFLIRSKMVYEENGKHILNNVVGKDSSYTDPATGMQVEKLVVLEHKAAAVPGTPGTLSVQIFETHTDANGLRRQVYREKEAGTCDVAQFKRLAQVSHHENLETLAEIHDRAKKWDVHGKTAEARQNQLSSQVKLLEADKKVQVGKLEYDDAMQQLKKEEIDANAPLVAAKKDVTDLSAQIKQKTDAMDKEIADLKSDLSVDPSRINNIGRAHQDCIDVLQGSLANKTAEVSRLETESRAYQEKHKLKVDFVEAKYKATQAEAASVRAEVELSKAKNQGDVVEARIKAATPGSVEEKQAQQEKASVDAQVLQLRNTHDKKKQEEKEAGSAQARADHQLDRHNLAEPAQSAECAAAVRAKKAECDARIEQAQSDVNKLREQRVENGIAFFPRDLPRSNDLPAGVHTSIKDSFKSALEDEKKALHAHERMKPKQELYGHAGTEFQKIKTHMKTHEIDAQRKLDMLTTFTITLAPMANQFYTNAMSMWHTQLQADADLSRSTGDAIRGQNDAVLKAMEQLASTWSDTGTRLLGAVMDAILNALQAAIRSVEAR